VGLTLGNKNNLKAMIIKMDDYQKMVNKNRIEKKLLSVGFKQATDEYNTFSKKIKGKKYSVEVRQSVIEFHVNKKLIGTIDYETKPYEFWEQLEFLNFMQFNNGG
jgi:hypothetical protein